MLARFLQVSLVFSIIFSALLSTSHAAKIYRWVDENGLPHYSEKPPRETQSETLNVRAAGTGSAPTTTTSAPSSTKQESVKTETAKKDDSISAEDKAKFCQQSRTLLERMNGNTQRRFEQPDGSFRKLEESEITDYISQAKEGIASYCN